MPYGDPPEGMWHDAFGYMPTWAYQIWVNQEPLGRPFEQAIYENVWDLYARPDKPSLWFWEW